MSPRTRQFALSLYGLAASVVFAVLWSRGILRGAGGAMAILGQLAAALAMLPALSPRAVIQGPDEVFRILGVPAEVPAKQSTPSKVEGTLTLRPEGTRPGHGDSHKVMAWRTMQAGGLSGMRTTRTSLAGALVMASPARVVRGSAWSALRVVPAPDDTEPRDVTNAPGIRPSEAR